MAAVMSEELQKKLLDSTHMDDEVAAKWVMRARVLCELKDEFVFRTPTRVIMAYLDESNKIKAVFQTSVSKLKACFKILLLLCTPVLLPFVFANTLMVPTLYIANSPNGLVLSNMGVDTHGRHRNVTSVPTLSGTGAQFQATLLDIKASSIYGALSVVVTLVLYYFFHTIMEHGNRLGKIVGRRPVKFFKKILRVLLSSNQDQITAVRFTGNINYVEFACLGYWSIVLSVSCGSLAVKSFVGALSGLAIASLFLSIANVVMGVPADQVEILSSFLKVAGPDNDGFSNGVLHRLDQTSGECFSCTSKELEYIDKFEGIDGPLKNWMTRLRRCMKKEGKEWEVMDRIAVCQIHKVFVTDKCVVIDCINGTAISIGRFNSIEDV